MTRERLVQGILQSVATVAFLPQVRPVIEMLLFPFWQTVYHQLGYWRTPRLLLFEKTMKECYAPRIQDLLFGIQAEAEETLRFLQSPDRHHPRDENGNLIDTGCSCHHPPLPQGAQL